MKIKNLSLADKFPEVAAEWHPTLNGDLTSQDFNPHSGIKKWWMCEKGHIWEAAISCRTDAVKKTGCPYCTKQKVCLETCLKFLFPEIASEWHFWRNGDITPLDVFSSTTKIFWWYRKECGHEWQASCASRTKRKSSCPYCANRKVCHENCLSTTDPHLISEWHPVLNGDLSPSDIVRGSPKNFWWMCKKGHAWQATPASRTGKNKTGCPYCGNKKVCLDNCLFTNRPDISSEWHPTKNGILTSLDFVVGSRYRAWWLGECGHEWQAAITKRTNAKSPTGCPVCRESKGEKQIRKILQLKNINFISQWPIYRRFLADFYLPEQNSIIEFQGVQHYVPVTFGSKKDNSKNYLFENFIINDAKKEILCRDKNIDVLYIPFWEYENIEKTIDSFMKKDEIIFSSPPQKVKVHQENARKIKFNFLNEGWSY